MQEVCMRRAGVFPILLALIAGPAWAQQELAPTTDQGPIAIKAGPPAPDKDGAYALSDAIVPPALTNAVPAAYPADAPDADRPHSIVLSVVVGVDGVPSGIHTIRSDSGPYEAAAIAAVQQSRFQPGTLDGKPVPVRVVVRVPFFHLAPAVPRLALHFGQGGTLGSQRPRDSLAARSGYTPPRPITTAEPEFTDKARKNKIQGVVTVSVLVNEEGVPIDPQITHSLEPGLDEKAIECALKYRFQPAMREGVPVAARITIEMNFRLY
jgi:TonB family protein